MSLHIGSNAAHDQGAPGGQHSPSLTETNFSPFEQGKHRLHNPSPRVSLYILYFMQWFCAYVYEFLCNLVALWKPLHEYLVYTYETLDDDSVLYLVM
jgi:hypothetical protein